MKTPYRVRTWTAWLLLVLLGIRAGAAGIVLEDCDDPSRWHVTRSPATVVAAPQPHEGKGAVAVTLPGMVTRTLARSYVPGSAAWDAMQGLSFWIKGDGSDSFGCLAVVGRFAYVTYFPLADTTWHRVTVSWADFVPESQVGALGTLGNMPPSGIRALRLGSRWTIGHNNARLPRCGFAVDRIELVDRVASPGPPPPPRSFDEITAILRQGGPLRIQCMGDSITAGTGLAERDKQRYAVLAGELLRRWLHNDKIVCYSRAVGGARSTDIRAWVPRDFTGPPPDLVTLWIGYNDKSGAYTREYFRYSVNDTIDRVCRATHGRSAFVLFATGPGCGPRFVMMDDYAQVIRDVGRERGIPVFDIHRQLKALGRETIEEYFNDMAHPNARGHRFIANAFGEFLVRRAGITTPNPGPPPRPDAPPGVAHVWDFEDGMQGWIFDAAEISLRPEAAGSGKQGIALCLEAPGKDHRRCFSPPMSVFPYQRYRVSCKARLRSYQAGAFGLYVVTYDNAACKGSFKVIPVKRGPSAPGAWTTLRGEVDVPEGVRGMRVMFWTERKSVANLDVDDVRVEPVNE